MKHRDEYREGRTARQWIDRIRERVDTPIRVMEVCGGQTHTLIRSGIDQLLEGKVELIHGPGCPVCVTPLEKIDRALELARRPEVILASYGDMLRVPGSKGDLLSAKSRGADVRIVYSPVDAVRLAEANPDRQVVFFAVGFETTAPANGMAVVEAKQRGVENFSALVSHVRVPPAVRAILDEPECRVQGFLAPGHVCAIMGTAEYEELAREYGVPFVVAGFEPLDLVHGIARLADMLAAGEVAVDNAYARTAAARGNPAAQRLLAEVYQVTDIAWRGIGPIPASGLRLTDAYADFDAERRFSVESVTAQESDRCIAGLVLQGRAKPHECPAFGRECTPDSPLGAPMVSSEGACAAYHAFRRDAVSAGS
ncbi:MAG TPA: hydrogenase formation protein HypD [Candidatus Krumholzibacteria bacterium]|nr:hydrogenase formation protein HypD [Candidatus Krumholzibacteria bacterium]